MVQYVPYAAIGSFLAIRRPRNVIGWLLIGIGFAFLGTSTPAWLDVGAIRAGSASTRDVVWAWFSVWSGSASFLFYAALAMVFPTGHLPDGRWGRPAIAALVAAAVVIVLPAFVQPLIFSPDGVNDLSVRNPVGLIAELGPEIVFTGRLLNTAIPIAVFAFAVIGLVLRYRRSDAVVRLQIRWLLASMAFLVVSVIFGLAVFVTSENTAFYAWIPALIAYPLVPIAVGIAVMRYRLFEIDRIISRTIAYIGVSAILFAVFAGVTLGIRSLVGSGLGDNALTVAVSTLAVAALFNPLRVRVQRLVDRRFNRSRYDQERAIERFTAGLRDEVDVDRLLDQVRAAVADAVEPSTIGVWRRDLQADR